jgi:uncharacterized damage-inducible protein DinB
MLVDAQRLLHYDRWANAETLQSIRAVTNSPLRALEVFAHIAAVHRLFLSRILNSGPVEVWPQPDLDAADRDLLASYEQWQNLFRSRTPDEEIQYVNSKGERWRSSILDIVTHVVIHSAYHRGQIAMLLGSTAGTPAYTDFIHCARNKFV